MLLEIFASSVIAGLVGGILSLDRTAAFQSMASRPLVSAPLMGLVLGVPGTGLAAGVILELLYMSDRPVGSYMPAHETGLAVVVTAVSAAFLKASPSIVSLSWAGGVGGVAHFMGTAGPLRVIVPVLFVSIPAAYLFRSADNFSRRMNEGLFLNALGSLDDDGTGKGVVRENLKGLFNFFWPTSAFIFVTVFILSFVARIFAGFVSTLDTAAFTPVVIAALILAISMALRAVRIRGSLIVFSVSGILTAVIWTFLR
ncbi:MAG: hypothetical protein V3V95_01180 [Thermodesulfobacteriota bacterium]